MFQLLLQISSLAFGQVSEPAEPLPPAAVESPATEAEPERESESSEVVSPVAEPPLPLGLVLAGGTELGPALAAGALALQLRPAVWLQLGEDFSAQLGAPLRFTSPGTLRLRDEDWDSLSDFGQILEAMSAAAQAAA